MSSLEINVLSPLVRVNFSWVETVMATSVTWDQYYKTIFAVIELSYKYSKILMHYFGPLGPIL